MGLKPPGALCAPGELASIALGDGLLERDSGVRLILPVLLAAFGLSDCAPGRGLDGFFFNCKLPRSRSEDRSELERIGPGRPGETDAERASGEMRPF